MVTKKTSKKTAAKPPVTGNVTVKVKTFRGQPAIHGSVHFSNGRKVRHPDTLVVTADEALASDLVEIVSEEEVTGDDFLD